MNQILLIDAYNIGHIAFHAMGELDHLGRKTGVIYGFLYQVLSLAKKHKTNRFVFCWDSKRSIRKLRYQGYKNRPKNNKVLSTGEILDKESLYIQIDQLRGRWLDQLGFKNNFCYTGLEADDTIALVIKNAIPPVDDIEWIIVSTDKDLYQLLAPNVTIYNTKTKSKYTQHNFKSDYGIDPSQWIHAKAIGGCDSDCIKGVEGIADPAKSKNSRAIKYILGELSDESRYVKDIESPQGQEIYRRNLNLVKLPLLDHIIPKFKSDDFSKNKFIEIFDSFGFSSFTKKEKLDEWIGVFCEKYETKRIPMGKELR